MRMFWRCDLPCVPRRLQRLAWKGVARECHTEPRLRRRGVGRCSAISQGFLSSNFLQTSMGGGARKLAGLLREGVARGRDGTTHCPKAGCDQNWSSRQFYAFSWIFGGHPARVGYLCNLPSTCTAPDLQCSTPLLATCQEAARALPPVPPSSTQQRYQTNSDKILCV